MENETTGVMSHERAYMKAKSKLKIKKMNAQLQTYGNIKKRVIKIIHNYV